MVSGNRIMFGVDPEFEKKMKELQKKIRIKKGEEVSLRELTAKISKDPFFENIEKRILDDKVLNLNLDIKLE